MRSELLVGFVDSDEFIEDSDEELEEELSAAEQEELRILAEIEFDDDSGDDEFIGALYHNVLERDPDADGQVYWLGQWVGDMARYDVLEAFANSADTGSGGADNELEVITTISGDGLIV